MRQPVVLDIDGTICFDGLTIDPAVVAAIRRVADGRRVVFASARPIRDLLPVLPDDLQAYPLVGGNGAFVRVDGVVEVVGIAEAARAALDAIIEEHSLAALVDGEWDYAFSGDEAHPLFRQLDSGRRARNVSRSQLPTYSKVVLFSREAGVRDAVGRTGLPFSVHDDEGTIDIAPLGVDKHAAIGRLGIADRAYTAFGNDANDVALLRHAQVSYRVGRHEGLAFADHTVAREAVAAVLSGLA